MKKNRFLAIIPARSGSKRIKGKNIKLFEGKPLVYYSIKQALASSLFDRVIVDTDSKKIADIAKKYGAEVPFLRPKHLATDSANVVDSVLNTLAWLRDKEKYIPTHVAILQTTSPLREINDIKKCIELMNKSKATTVLTVCPTHPRLYNMDENKNIILVNGSEKQSTNIQAWRPGYILNGCFVYLVKTEILIEEKKIITKNTKAIVCEKWRSVDLDTPEDWVLAEFLYKNKNKINERLKKF